MWPHETWPWFHSWYRGRVETLDTKYLLVWPHEIWPWFHSWYRGTGRVETLDANYNLIPYLFRQERDKLDLLT